MSSPETPPVASGAFNQCLLLGGGVDLHIQPVSFHHPHTPLSGFLVSFLAEWLGGGVTRNPLILIVTPGTQ